MSGNTKTTLAIIFGVVGILLGALGTITAYNAKDAVDSDSEFNSEVQALVDQRFNEAQSRQDQLEASQKTEAERFVDQLTRGEKNLLQKINGNHKGVNRLRRKVRNLRNQLNSLKSRDQELSREVDQLENELASEYSQVNSRINKTNQQVQKLQRQVANLRGLTGQ